MFLPICVLSLTILLILSLNCVEDRLLQNFINIVVALAVMYAGFVADKKTKRSSMSLTKKISYEKGVNLPMPSIKSTNLTNRAKPINVDEKYAEQKQLLHFLNQVRQNPQKYLNQSPSASYSKCLSLFQGVPFKERQAAKDRIITEEALKFLEFLKQHSEKLNKNEATSSTDLTNNDIDDQKTYFTAEDTFRDWSEKSLVDSDQLSCDDKEISICSTGPSSEAGDNEAIQDYCDDKEKFGQIDAWGDYVVDNFENCGNGDFQSYENKLADMKFFKEEVMSTIFETDAEYDAHTIYSFAPSEGLPEDLNSDV